MRESYRSSNISRKSFEAGILLAYNTQRCDRPSQEMQNLPGARQNIAPPVRALNINHQPLALPAVGFGHIGTSAHWQEPVQIHNRRSRLLHQVGRGRALSTITEQKIRNFLWRAIICRFGIPRALVSDNRKQFDNAKFRDFCVELGIKNYYSSPAHPQSNGQAEVTIRTLKAALKTKLEDLKGSWVEYLPKVLWAYRTSQKSATRETPFALAFSTEVVAPVEVEIQSPRVKLTSEEDNDKALRLNLELLDEKREQVQRRTEEYQRKTARYYNQRVISAQKVLF